MSRIGERVKHYRKEKKMTLTQVAGNQMSAAMVSLIENGKTKPTVQTLEHIANQLGIEPNELMGERSRTELRESLDEVNGLYRSYDQNALYNMIEKLKELLPHTSFNYESARINELYARVLFEYYQFFIELDHLVEFGDWEEPALKAKQIYKDLQYDSRSLYMDVFFIEVEYSHANYSKTLDMLHHLSNEFNNYEESFEVKSIISEVYPIKVNTALGLGMWNDAYTWLDEAIMYCKKNIVFHGFYNLQNTAVMLNYNDGNREQAQYHLDEIDKFLSLTENKALSLEKNFNHTHYEEFFNNNFYVALELCEQLEKELEDVEILPGEIHQKFKEHINEQKARCYTKMREPDKALKLFNDGLSSRFIVDHPLDRSLRDITFSYRASCYQQLGEVEKAIDEAKISVEKLKSYPHTAYYQFAREVLKDVKQLENDNMT